MNENTANSQERKNPAAQANGQEQDIGQLLQVRREKLAALQQDGKDPFKIINRILRPSSLKKCLLPEE